MKTTIIILALSTLLASCGAEYRQELPARQSAPPPANEMLMMERTIKKSTPARNTTSVDAVMSQLTTQAALAFKIPDTANVSERIRAQLLVDLNKSQDQLAAENTVVGKSIVGTVKTSRIVSARLVAPDFEVTAVEPAEQVLLAGQTAVWNWSLLPRSSGTYDVTLTIDARVEIGGREKTAHVRTFERTVQITVTPTQVMMSFISEYWQWLWSALLIPAAVWLWPRLVKWGRH